MATRNAALLGSRALDVCQTLPASWEFSTIVRSCPCWGEGVIPKKQLKSQTPHTGGLPVSAFCNRRVCLFLHGNSFQKRLAAEPGVASGYPLAEIQSEVCRHNPFWLSLAPLDLPCSAFEAPSESCGSPLALGRIFFYWNHLSGCPGS